MGQLGKRCMVQGISVALAMAAMALSPYAHAADDSGLYLGMQLYGAFRSSSGDGDVSAGGTLGYRFNQYLGVEASYKKTHLKTPYCCYTTGDIHGAEIAVRGTAPLSDWLSLTGKLGAYRWQAGEYPGWEPNRGTDPIIGAGLLFRVAEHVSLSTEYEHIVDFGAHADDNLASFGVRLDF